MPSKTATQSHRSKPGVEGTSIVLVSDKTTCSVKRGLNKGSKAKRDSKEEPFITLRFNPAYPRANLSIGHEFENLLDEYKYNEFDAAVAFFHLHDDYPLRVVHDSLALAYKAVYPTRPKERLTQLLTASMLKYHQTIQGTSVGALLFSVCKKGSGKKK